MKNLLEVCILMMLFTSNLFSQIDREIGAYIDSTELMVKNGRKMMLKELSDSNFNKTKEVYDYLTNLTENDHFAAFYYVEDLYINLLADDWERVEKLIIEYENVSNRYIYPGCVDLIQPLYNAVLQRSERILASVHQAPINDQTKSVLEILLHYIKTGNADESYNRLLASHRKEYQDPRYERFEKDFLPRKHIKGAWNFSLGSGVVFTTGHFSENYSNNVAFCMGMDFNVQKVFSSLYLQGTDLKLQKPFSALSGIDTMHFKLEEKFSFLNFGLKGGYFLLRNDRFHLAPFVSISGSSLKSNRYEDSEDNDLEYEVFNSFSYGVGLHTEVKIKEFSNKNAYYPVTDYGYFSIKLETGYNRITKFKDDHTRGDTPYVICSLVLGFGSF